MKPGQPSDTIPAEQVIPVVRDLLIEMASEIDIHYANDEIPALEHTFMRMQGGVDLMRQLGGELPANVVHTMNRYVIVMSKMGRIQ